MIFIIEVIYNFDNCINIFYKFFIVVRIIFVVRFGVFNVLIIYNYNIFEIYD